MALFFSFLVVQLRILNNMLLLITRIYLSLAQASYSFKHLNMSTLTHTTPTFVTETFCLVACVQLFKRHVKVIVTAYTKIRSLLLLGCLYNPSSITTTAAI